MNTEDKFVEMLSGFDTAMLVTMSDDGIMFARPMAVAETERDGDLWFVTRQSSGKVIDIEHNAHVCVTMQSSRQFVTMSGRALITKDRSKINSIWQEKWKVWFPDGKDDPSLLLIQVIPTHGEYWDNSGSQGLQYLFEAGKGYLQGTTLPVDEAVNAKVTLESTWIE